LSNLKVGILTLLSIVAVVYMALMVTSNQSGFGEYITYRTIINDATGIFPKTPIKVAGINAGRIKKIDLIGTQALVTFEVLKRIQISSTSVLRIKSVGFLGDKYLDIYLGEVEGATRLAESELIPSETGGGLEDLTKDASVILKDLKAVMRSVKESLAPEERETPLKGIVDNIGKTAQNLQDMTARLASAVKKNERKINEMLANFSKVSGNLARETDRYQKESLMADLQKVGPILDDAKNAMNNLKIIIADLKAGKGTVGKLLRDEQIVDQVSTTLAGVNRIVNRVNGIHTELYGFAGADTERDNATEFGIDLYTKPGNFYRVGLVTTEFGPYSKTERTTTVNNVGTVESIDERSKDSFRFNVQFGRKFQSWVFRLGAIESTGGVGVDYFLERFGTKFTFEVFDYQEKIGPNVRFMTEFHFWNVFYGRLAAQDIISNNDRQSFLIAAGLRFTDDDLRTLIGFFL